MGEKSPVQCLVVPLGGLFLVMDPLGGQTVTNCNSDTMEGVINSFPPSTVWGRTIVAMSFPIYEDYERTSHQPKAFESRSTSSIRIHREPRTGFHVGNEHPER